MHLFIVTTHYPYGTWEETFFATELEVLAEKCESVTLLPLKELDGVRKIPSKVNLLAPLIGKQRIQFFLLSAIRPKTWRYFVSAMKDLFSEPKFMFGSISNCLKFASYRAAIAGHSGLREFILRQGAKLVYGYWAHFPALAALEAHARGVPACIRYHSGDLYEELFASSGNVYPWRNELRHVIDMHVFVSEHGKAYFEALPHRPAAKLTKVHHLGSPDAGEPRARRPTDPSKLVMVSVSSITHTKRVHLISSLARALAREGAVEWHHFGSGINSDLDRMLSEEVPALVRVMHGDTPNTDIQAFFRSTNIDFFVNMSLSEGVPVSLMEAVNANIPVIATRVGGTPELIIDGRSGFTVSCDECLDSDGLAVRVRKELQPGGLLAISEPRKVWEQGWNAHVKALEFHETILDLARLRS